MNSKIQTYHQERFAYIYLRQSTMNQVKNNQESTQRQYKALSFLLPLTICSIVYPQKTKLDINIAEIQERINSFKMLPIDS